VKEHLERAYYLQAHYQHSRAYDPRDTILPGARVYVKEHGLKTALKKFRPRFRGPYRVIQLLPHFRYELKDLKNGKLGIYHAAQIKLIKELNIPIKLAPKARKPFLQDINLPDSLTGSDSGSSSSSEDDDNDDDDLYHVQEILPIQPRMMPRGISPQPSGLQVSLPPIVR
jgi:hypothetical protein